MIDAFSHFIDSCSKHFDFIIEKYSFSVSEPKVNAPECCVEYRKDELVLDIIYEYGDFPWIRVTKKGKANSLDNIIKKNHPDCTINRKKGPSQVNEKVDFVLEKYSAYLSMNINDL